MFPGARVQADEYDLVLVGGGLQNGLIALQALHAEPARRIALVEAGPELGGNHTWCVHALDVPSGARPWFSRLVVARWPAYEVRFPSFARTIAAPYAVVNSAQFARVVAEAFAASPGSRVFTGRRAIRIAAREVELDDGHTLRGRFVVDARGPDPDAYGAATGYQKFLGLELETAPHGVTYPILMDATCAQTDGFRFFYVLPLTPERLLIEETRFSATRALDAESARAAIYRYAERFGVQSCLREEIGVLPMPWSASVRHTAWSSPLVAGYRGGYFHPATGYSMPAALRLAELVGTRFTDAAMDVEWRRFARRHRAQVSYAEQLNRLLFNGFAETDMWGVFERFYRLPEDLIARFYALSLSVPDRARILVGRPPRGFSVKRMLLAGATT